MQWIPTFTLFLFLYPLGWFIANIFYLFNKNIGSNYLSIIGTIITFFLFITILPSWGRTRWKTNHVWTFIGIDVSNKSEVLKIFINGFFWSLFLIFIFLIFIFSCNWIDDFNYLSFNSFLNAILLIVGIVFAEELIFRGWLLEEMIFLFGFRRGIVFQSAIFSLAHYRSDIDLMVLIPFMGGLFLFGIVLTFRRIIDRGALWGCIGLHGGLVGIWYLFDSGLIIFSKDIPYYFLGPSSDMVNPIGSILGILILVIIIFLQRKLFAKSGRFLASTINASSSDEIP